MTPERKPGLRTSGAGGGRGQPVLAGVLDRQLLLEQGDLVVDAIEFDGESLRCASTLRCPHCGYDLRELPGDPDDGATVCPGCGCAWKLSQTENPEDIDDA